MVIVEVAEPHRRCGAGSALLGETGRELRRAGVARQIAGIWGDQPGATAFLAANRFRLYETACTVGWNGAPYSVDAGELPCVLYEGGDDTLDQEIAGLLNTGFRGDTIVGPISAEDLRHAIAGYGAWFMTARDPATDQLVGVLECHANGYFCTISVAREFRGTGLSRRLTAASMDRCRAAGRREVFAHIRTTNAASLRLVEELGWQRRSDMTLYAAETGAGEQSRARRR